MEFDQHIKALLDSFTDRLIAGLAVIESGRQLRIDQLSPVGCRTRVGILRRHRWRFGDPGGGGGRTHRLHLNRPPLAQPMQRSALFEPSSRRPLPTNRACRGEVKTPESVLLYHPQSHRCSARLPRMQPAVRLPPDSVPQVWFARHVRASALFRGLRPLLAPAKNCCNRRRPQRAASRNAQPVFGLPNRADWPLPRKPGSTQEATERATPNRFPFPISSNAVSFF